MADLRFEGMLRVFRPVYHGETGNRLRELEQKVSEEFRGQPLTWELRSRVTEFAAAAMPPPRGYRWETSRDGDSIALSVEPARPGIPESYVFAARVTTGFDGGNHDLRGDLWKCRQCAAVIVPGDYGDHDRHHAEIRRLQEEITEIRGLLAEVGR